MFDDDETTSANMAMADLIVQRALVMMQERGISRDVALDRLTTAAAGAHVQILGSEAAADCWRVYAQKIEGGIFDDNTKH